MVSANTKAAASLLIAAVRSWSIAVLCREAELIAEQVLKEGGFVLFSGSVDQNSGAKALMEKGGRFLMAGGGSLHRYRPPCS